MVFDFLKFEEMYSNGRMEFEDYATPYCNSVFTYCKTGRWEGLGTRLDGFRKFTTEIIFRSGGGLGTRLLKTMGCNRGFPLSYQSRFIMFHSEHQQMVLLYI